jgi:1-deoxy-D-xylulose-5-phosphate synthase
LNSEKEILSKIGSPSDLKKLNIKEKELLASEIRKELIDVISENGGHLAPNLGVVELTIALHSVFNMPTDKILWDVGHQGYVHKILTGRCEFFKTLRKDDGCLGFLSREESEYDSFGAGHAGTAISAALGFAAARDINKGSEKVIAVVGDGALNCGTSLEGLNNVVETTDDFIIVLNDNKMSISRNVGGMARYLNRLISARRYNKLKAVLRKMVRSIPIIGDEITRKIAKLEEAAKSMFVPGVIFEELGIRYIGPVDGHDINELIRTFNVIKEFSRPIILHVITEKGRGCEYAAASPEKFHGLSCFNPKSGNVLNSSPKTYSQAFGENLCYLAENYNDVIGVTAAMCSGTGMKVFAEKYQERFFDVGIAEEHALLFVAGMAAAGKKCIIALYASFMQRALDYVMHDICLQNLPVIICLDRAGIVDDGPTHHGIHDLSFLKILPNISILAPYDELEMKEIMSAAYKHNGPVVIRYPRGVIPSLRRKKIKKFQWGKAEIIEEGQDVILWGMGREVETALEISKIISKKGYSVGVVNTRFIKPFDSELLKQQAKKALICTIEDCQIEGGLGGIVDSHLVSEKHSGVLHFGWDDSIIPHGTIKGIREKYNLTADKIAENIIKKLL